MLKKGMQTEVNDGREDAIMFVFGERFITIHQEGYRKLGLDYNQAKELIVGLGNLFIAVTKFAEPPKGTNDPTT